MKKRKLFTSLRMLLIFTLLTGIIYPLFITGIAQWMLPKQAHGSLIITNGKLLGSSLIGQSFDSISGYFSSRPSAVNYNPMPSGGSNFGTTNAKQFELIKERSAKFLHTNHLPLQTPIPSEMVMASASGLDPHISPEAAILQLDRVCSERKFTTIQRNEVRKIIENLTEKPQFLCLGEPRINVVLLNLEIDQIK